MADALKISPLVSISAAPFEPFVAFFPHIVEAGFPDSTGLSVNVLNRAVRTEIFAVGRRKRKNK